MRRVTHGEQTEQRLQRIAHLFGEVNRTYFDGVIPAPKILMNPRLTHTAGQVCFVTWAMEISPTYHDHYDWEDELLDTIKHEAVHLFLAHKKRPRGHTREFQEHCKRIRCSLQAKPMPRRRPRYLYLVECPHCGRRYYRGNRGRNIACAACCDAYNEGRFSPEFVFDLLEREIIHASTAAEAQRIAPLQQELFREVVD